MAIGYGLLNIIYHYKSTPVNINIILLYVISFLFYVAYLNMYVFHFLVFDYNEWHSVFLYPDVPTYLLIMRLLACTVTIVTFLILRHADIRHKKSQ